MNEVGAGPSREPALVVLPFVRMLLTGLCAAIVAALPAALVSGEPGPMAAGAGSAWAAAGLSLGVMRPWKRRSATSWPMLLVAAQGISLFVTLGGVLGVHAGLRPNLLWLGLTATLAFIGVWIAFAKSYEHAARSSATLAPPLTEHRDSS